MIRFEKCVYSGGGSKNATGTLPSGLTEGAKADILILHSYTKEVILCGI